GRALRQERALARCGLRRGRLVAGVRARVLSDREERAPAEQDRARHREEDPSPAGEACSARGRRAGSRHRCLPDGDHSPFPSPEIESTVPWNTTGADAPRTRRGGHGQSKDALDGRDGGVGHGAHRGDVCERPGGSRERAAAGQEPPGERHGSRAAWSVPQHRRCRCCDAPRAERSPRHGRRRPGADGSRQRGGLLRAGGGRGAAVTFLGADTEQLRVHGELVRIGAGRVDELIRQVRGAAANTPWQGPDAESFRRSVQATADAAHGVVEQLSSRGDELARHADEQDEASGLGDGIRGTAEPGSGQKFEDGGDAEGTEPLEEDIPLDGEDTQIENTAQGGIADCYLLSSLGAITQLDPDFLDQHVEEIDDGVYRVTMYDENGDEITYVVESTPENGARFDTEEGGHSVFSIYERAYQMHLEQHTEGDTLDWGSPVDAMQTMTGQDASYYGGEDTPSLEDME